MKSLFKPTSLVPLALVSLLAGLACSPPTTSPAPGESAPEAGAPDHTSGDGLPSSPGGYSQQPSAPAPATESARFKFRPKDRPLIAGRARIEIHAPEVWEGRELPGFVAFNLGTPHAEETGPSVGIYRCASLEEVLALQSWHGLTTAPGAGCFPDGNAAVWFRLGEHVETAPLMNGALSITRGNGTLSGKLTTGTAAGDIAFDGLYDVTCSAPADQPMAALPGELPQPLGPPGTLKEDPGMTTAFCQQFAFLRGQ